MSRAQWCIYRTEKIEGEWKAEQVEGPMPKAQAVKRADMLSRQSAKEANYPGYGLPLPTMYTAMNPITGRISYGQATL